MMSSSPSPKLPKWIFFLADAILLLTAWFIASRSTGALSATAITAITACVIVGAIVGTVPLLLHYEREKNETLDDRQRALEALALTLTTAAEQIGIAAQGLHEIAELTRKNLQQAESLPQQLGAKVAALQAQLNTERDEEREELKKDLTTLRAIESEQLAATATKVQHAAAELGKLEAAAQKSLAASQAALASIEAKLAAGTSAALAEVESRLAARAASTLAAIEATRRAPAPEAEGGESRSKHPLRRATDVGRAITPVVPPTAAPFAGHLTAIESTETPAESPKPEPAAESPSKEEPKPEPEAKPAETPAAEAPVEPVAVVPAPEAAAPATEAESTPAAVAEPKPKKPRAPRKPKPAEPSAPLDLGIAEAAAPVVAAVSAADDFSQVPPNEPVEKSISADGATRLLVTAYIGIGNRLFIRGDGPGLTWDKGVPLQFVSIGKWRWETAEATAPVQYKLYKNDELECAALGAQTLESGSQQEVTATF